MPVCGIVGEVDGVVGVVGGVVDEVGVDVGVVNGTTDWGCRFVVGRVFVGGVFTKVGMFRDDASSPIVVLVHTSPALTIFFISSISGYTHITATVTTLRTTSLIHHTHVRDPPWSWGSERPPGGLPL